MKNIFKFTGIITLGILLGCQSKKNNTEHSHDGGEAHSHATKSSVESINYFGAYDLENKEYGTITKMTLTEDERIMVTNALPNHKTGKFPNQGNPNAISAQNQTYSFPLEPKYTGKATWAREPGVALNGIKFEPGTAEVVECDTGENYRVEALQDVIDLGLDFNHAHVQPTGAYHYHGTPTSVIEEFDAGEDLVHVGFAHDGFPMYYSKSGKFKPSYKAIEGDREGEDCTYENPHQSIDISVGGHHDGTFTSDYEYVAGSGDLDECNGITINGDYMYLVTVEFPYISRCLMGDYEEARPQGGGQRVGGEQPDATELISKMDNDNDGKLSKAEVKGPLSERFSKVDTDNDGFITKQELEKAKTQTNQRPQGGIPIGRRN